jgi:hypothetical protein
VRLGVRVSPCVIGKACADLFVSAFGQACMRLHKCVPTLPVADQRTTAFIVVNMHTPTHFQATPCSC